jgi:SSS family solute:Na+ symporter
VVQTVPAIVLGALTRWFHRWALLAGWAAGMAYGTLTAYHSSSPTQAHFASATAPLPFPGPAVYIALTAFVLNMLVTVALTLMLKALRVSTGSDETSPADYGRNTVQRQSGRSGGTT